MPIFDNSLKSLVIDGKEVMLASLNGKVFYDNSYKLNLTASKPIIQTGETTVFTAGLTYRRAPVQGETVIFHSEDVLESTVVDSDGTYDFGDCFIVDLTTIPTNGYLEIGRTKQVAPDIALYKYSNPSSYNVSVLSNGLKEYSASRIMFKNGVLFIESSNNWVEAQDVSNIDLTSWYIFSGASCTVGTYFYETGITDSNGECSVSYVGKGAGALNIKAECMNLTKTYVIMDSLFKDNGTLLDYNANWTNPNNRFNVVRDSGGTLLTSNVAWAYWQANNNAVFSAPLCVEFDVVSFTETPSIRFRNNNANSPYGINENGHHKILFGTDSIQVIVNGTSKTHWIPVSILELPFTVFFECSDANESVKYKNFLIYPI